MKRRRFLEGVAAAGAARLLAADSAPRTNPERLRRDLEGLSVFGRPAGGSFADGVSRVAYSDADIAGRQFVMDLMRAARLEPRVDAAGNIFALRKGTGASLAPVLFGSHIDSVPSGGNFDGDLGSLAAIEVARTLHETGLTTRRPLEIVVWSNEEGVAFNNGLCGSRAAAGNLDVGELDQVWNGMKKADAIRRIGGAPERIAGAQRAKDSFHAYLELHIEQGGSLEKAGIPIGVVEGIVAIDRYWVDFKGFANHAGTTPMPDRHDALLAASELTIAVHDAVTRIEGRQVGTVGQLNVSPNAPNVVPGAVRMTVELRDLSEEKLKEMARQIRAKGQEIAVRTRTEFEMTLASRHEAAFADRKLQSAIEESARKLGLQSARLPSGAGHDAQSMARLGPMGMIFIPSIGGISHSPRELSRWEDCARGADVLLQAVLALAS